MDTEKGFKKLLALAGIAALIVLPVVAIMKKRSAERNEVRNGVEEDESNIFAAELDQ